jgi:hypothetical protein
LVKIVTGQEKITQTNTNLEKVSGTVVLDLQNKHHFSNDQSIAEFTVDIKSQN